MKTSNHTLRYHDLYIEGFALLALVISFSEPIMLIVLGVYLVILRRRIRWRLLAIFVFLVLARFLVFQIGTNQAQIHDTVQVVAVDDYAYSHRLTINYQFHKYHVYTYDEIAVGDYVYLHGDVKAYVNETIPDGFNAYTYYLCQNVYGQIDVYELRFVRHGFHLMTLREKIMDNVSTNQQPIVNAFVFGKNHLDETSKDLYRSLNILFLMQTTGLHAYIMVLIIKKGMFYFNVCERTKEGVVLFIYGVLCYINAFSLGVVRLLLTQVFRLLNKRFKWRFTPLDRLFIICYIMIMIAFWWVYSTGLFMTFLIIITLELTRDRYHSYSGYLKRLIMSLFIVLVCLPFTKAIAPLTIVLLPLIIIYVTCILYPLSIISCFVNGHHGLLDMLINGFNSVMTYLNQQTFVLYLPALNHITMMVYYGLFVYVLLAIYKKQFMIRLFVLSSVFGYSVLSKRYIDEASVYFLDVGQGDTIYIESRSCQVMIDSFEGSTDFLKNHGVYHLDYLFLTHSDDDHTKEAHDIIHEVGVSKVVINPYDTYDSYHTPVVIGHAGQSIRCGNLTFQVLGPLKRYETANDNSLVLSVMIEGDKFLFTGDIGKQVEHDLVSRYGSLLKSDVLKVAHHGSDTSTAKSFISVVQPSYAVISVGRRNQFHFPHLTTLETLSVFHVKVYRTDEAGTIILRYKGMQKLWETTINLSRFLV